MAGPVNVTAKAVFVMLLHYASSGSDRFQEHRTPATGFPHDLCRSWAQFASLDANGRSSRVLTLTSGNHALGGYNGLSGFGRRRAGLPHLGWPCLVGKQLQSVLKRQHVRFR